MDHLLTAVGNSGGVVVLTHNDKTYTFHQLTDEMRAELTASMHLHYITQLQSRRSMYPVKAYRELQSDLERDLSNSKYTFGSENYLSYIETDVGAARLMRVLLRNNAITDDEMASLLEAKGSEVAGAIAAAHGLKLNTEGEKTGETPDPKA